MERIFINKTTNDYAIEYLATLKQRSSAVFRLPTEKLTMLRDFFQMKGVRYAKYASYIDAIIMNYDDIIKLRPGEFDTFKQTHFNMLEVIHLKKKFKYQKSKKFFYEHVVDAMRYKWVRENVYLKFGLKLGIKACVYCNAQYATTATVNGKIVATYDLDHYYPKSRYPFLCTSFYNLVPVCARCNRVKSDNKPTFCMYTEDKTNLRPIRFILNPQSVIKYMLSHHAENLDINISASSLVEKPSINEHIRQFGLDDLYAAHKDVAEEILWKTKIYNKSFRQQLERQFGKLFPHMEEKIDRFITGYSLQRGDVHKRPFTLMGQDIYTKYRQI